MSSANVSDRGAHWEPARCRHWCQSTRDADWRARRHWISAAAETTVNWLVAPFPTWTGHHCSVWTEVYFCDEQLIVLRDWQLQWWWYNAYILLAKTWLKIYSHHYRLGDAGKATWCEWKSNWFLVIMKQEPEMHIDICILISKYCYSLYLLMTLWHVNTNVYLHCKFLLCYSINMEVLYL